MKDSVTRHHLWSLNTCVLQERKHFVKIFLPLLSLFVIFPSNFFYFNNYYYPHTKGKPEPVLKANKE